MKEVLSYLVTIAGLVVTAIAYVQIVGKQKYDALQPMVMHMLRTSSNRAEMMCHNNEGTVLEAVGRSITAGALTYSRDPVAVAAGTLPAYTAACTPLAQRWEKCLKLAKTGVLMAVGGAALAILVDASSMVQLALAVVAGIAALLVLLFKLDVERSLVLARAQLLPEVDRMFVEGRYAYARPPE